MHLYLSRIFDGEPASTSPENALKHRFGKVSAVFRSKNTQVIDGALDFIPKMISFGSAAPGTMITKNRDVTSNAAIATPLRER
jgi:hypothetical protein